jgi:tetratricopeptide (TPR) repeat protein
MALGRQGQREEARAQFERAARVAESRPLARLASATFAEALGEWGEIEESRRLFQNVLAKEPDNPLFLRNYARVLWDRDERGALRLLERAVGLAPKDPISHCCLGAALADLGDDARAKDHLEIALRLEPTYARAAELLKELMGDSNV